MLDVLQIIALTLVVLAMVPALAHALELPGKLRLTREAYIAVQGIYYPGFTIAGISEPLAIVASIVLLALTPRDSASFWLTLVALVGMLGMHAAYWIVTHPVNNFWLQGQRLSRAGSGFFAFASARRRGDQAERRPPDWTELRDRWEYSHVARAGLAGLSFIALVVAVASERIA